MPGFKGGTRDKLRELARLMRAEYGRDPFDVYEEMGQLIDALRPAT